MSTNVAGSGKRLWVLLAALCGIVLMGVAYMLIFSGSGDESIDSLPAPGVVQGTGSASGDGSFEDSVRDGAGTATDEAPKKVKSDMVTQAQPGRDPFDPLVDEQASSDTGSGGTDQSGSSSSDPQTKKSSSSGQAGNYSSKSSQMQKPDTKSDPAPSNGDKSSAKTEPVAPEVVGGPDADSQVSVHVVDVTDDYVIVRIDGVRTRLVRAIPGEQGVTFVSPLSAGCAWIGRDQVDVRMAMCKGDTEKI